MLKKSYEDKKIGLAQKTRMNETRKECSDELGGGGKLS